MKYAYAALFQNDEDWINVKFVDCPDWFTCGKNISEAIEYAVDMLNIRLYDLEREGKAAPTPTNNSFSTRSCRQNNFSRPRTAFFHCAR